MVLHTARRHGYYRPVTSGANAANLAPIREASEGGSPPTVPALQAALTPLNPPTSPPHGPARMEPRPSASPPGSPGARSEDLSNIDQDLVLLRDSIRRKARRQDEDPQVSPPPNTLLASCGVLRLSCCHVQLARSHCVVHCVLQQTPPSVTFTPDWGSSRPHSPSSPPHTPPPAPAAPSPSTESEDSAEPSASRLPKEFLPGKVHTPLSSTAPRKVGVAPLDPRCQLYTCYTQLLCGKADSASPGIVTSIV